MMPLPSVASPRHWLLLAALFLIAGFGVYANSLNGPFHFDDRHGIVDNHTLRDPANIPKFFSYPQGRYYFAPSEPQATHYRPLLLTSYAVNFQLGGESVVGFHLYNLLLHVIGALLLTALGTRLGLSLPWAAGVGLVFLLHPLQTEAINYITARSSLQSGVLSFAAFLAFIHARSRATLAALPWLALCGLFTIGAVLTKEVAVTLPLIFFAYDLLYPPPKARRWGVNGYGLDLGLMLSGLLFLVVQNMHKYFMVVLAGGHGPRGVGENLWLQAQVLLTYIRMTLLPTGLSILHDFSATPAGPTPAALLSAAILLTFAVGAVVLRRRIPLVAMGLALFILVLLPTTILPMNTPLQESRGYAAVGGILLALAALLSAATGRLNLNRRWAWLVLPVIILLALGTVQRNTVWQSDLNLWTDAATKAPKNYRAQANLGSAHHAKGNLAAAIDHYRAAIALYDHDAAVYSDLGGALFQSGQLAEAKAVLQQSFRVYDAYAPAHYNMAMVLERQGNTKVAERAYRRALKLVPSYTEARVNLGILLAKGGDLAGGAEQMEQALVHQPGGAQIYPNLMGIYVAMGEADKAHALYQKARKYHAVSPHLERAYGRLSP